MCARILQVITIVILAHTCLYGQPSFANQNTGQISQYSVSENGPAAVHTLNPHVDLFEDDLLVVELSYGSLLLEESFFVYRTPEYTLIPLQGLIDTLDFPLEIDLDAKTVDGWFITEASQFSLDIAQKTLYIRGEKRPWPKHLNYALDDFDLYIDSENIEKWFNLTLDLDVSQLSLSLSSQQTLPIIKIKQRAAERAKLNKELGSVHAQNYIANEYDWLGQPSLDIELSYDAESNDIGGKQNNLRDYKSAIIQGTMDVLKHSLMSSYINQNGEQDLRLTFSRASAGPDTSMHLGLDAYQFGDISSHSDTLLFGSASGSGLHLKRGKNALLEQSNDLLIEGDAPPGWEVELYRNGTLIDFTSPSTNGQYQFINIATFMGENIFDVRIYGPQGQFRTTQRKITVGSNMLAKGLWDYQAFALKKNHSLLPSELNDSESASNFYHTEASYGLNERLTLQAGLTSMTPNENAHQHDYTFISLYTSLNGGLAHFKVAKDLDSGTALSATYKSRWQDINYNVSLLKFNHLISDRNQNGQLSMDAKFRVNGLWQNITPQALSYDFEVRRMQFRSGKQKQWNIANRLSTRLGQTQLAHSLVFNHSNVSGIEDALDSNLSATQRWMSWRLKAEVNSSILPSGELESINTSASYQPNKKLSYQALVGYQHNSDSSLLFNNTLTWNFKPASISITAGFDNDNKQFVGLTLTSSLSYDHSTQSLAFDQHSYATSANVLAHAYIDENNNSLQDEDENALEGVIFTGRHNWKYAPTNEAGYTTLSGVPNLSMQKIAIDTRSIEDPFLKPKQSNYQLYSHAGKQTMLSFQLVPSLEIEGSVQLIDQKGSNSIPGVPIALFNSRNQLVAQTRSEFDGVFILEGILPGHYHLKIDASYLQKKGFLDSPVMEIRAYSEEGIIYLAPIELHKKL
jgi:hypothetical protein